MKIINLFFTLSINARCTNIHVNQAKYPLNLMNGKSTTALFLPIVAITPILVYSYCRKGLFCNKEVKFLPGFLLDSYISNLRMAF